MQEIQSDFARYSTVHQKKATGSHYTPTLLADFVAKELVKLTNLSSPFRILDPAIGDGELILALLAQLQPHAIASIQIIGFDTDANALHHAENRILEQHPDIQIDFRHIDFLDFAIQYHKPDLFHPINFSAVDMVISNPPYVRTQIIGSERSRQLAKLFNLSRRVDLAFAFIKAIEWVLKPYGLAGIIVSNRFMTTKSGAKVRENLQKNFHIHHVWDLGDTKLFDAAVLPAILFLEKNKTNLKESARFSKIYTTQKSRTYEQKFEHVIDALSAEGVIETIENQRFQIQHGRLSTTTSPDEVWRISNEESKNWLEKVQAHTYCHFEELGKIRVGVKTTADKIFIRDDWETFGIEGKPELLKTVMTHHVGRRFRSIETQQQRQILYTHEYRDGKRQAVDLTEYPQSANYLEVHRSTLEKRSYLKKAKRNWYEIWVPQDPQQWHLPKLVFRDITDRPMFWVDFSGAIVNGDCYWMTFHHSLSEEVLWLALAVANSTFIEHFYDYRFNNKLYAGRRRYITQYVEKFPLPDPTTALAQTMIEKCQTIYEQISVKQVDLLESELDQLVWSAFGF